MSDFDPDEPHRLNGDSGGPDDGESWYEPAAVDPWYRRPGPVTAAVLAALTGIVGIIVLVVALSGDDDDRIATVDLTPSPVPTETVDVTPTPPPTTEPSPEPDASATPAGTPTPQATPTSEATATPEPTTTPEPTPEPSATPEPTAIPTATPQPSPSPTRCSASGADSLELQLDLPDPVQSRRAEIGNQARSCDIAGLVALTADDFTASFGGGDPASIWETGEAEGDAPLRRLVDILTLPYATIDGADPGAGSGSDDDELIYVWPSAHAYESWADVPRTDRQALLAVYTQGDLDDFEAAGTYLGHRVGITESGDWIFFVSGD